MDRQPPRALPAVTSFAVLTVAGGESFRRRGRNRHALKAQYAPERIIWKLRASTPTMVKAVTSPRIPDPMRSTNPGVGQAR